MKIIATTLWVCWFTASAIPGQEASKDGPLIFDKRLSQWIKLLRDPSKVVRYRAAKDLGRIGPRASAAVPALVEALKDENGSVREYAAWAIGQIGPQAKDVPALIETVQDKNWSVRRAAAYVLGDIGPRAKAALPALKKFKGAPFAYAIVQIAPNDETGIPYLIEEMNRRDYNTRRRDWAIQALGRIGPRAKAALPALKAVLKNKDNHVYHRMNAAYAVALIDPCDKVALPFLRTLTKSYSSGASGSALYLLSQMGPPAKTAVAALITELAANKGQFFRCVSLVRALGRIGPDAKAALPILRELTRHSNAIIRKAAALAIYKIKRP